MPRGGRRPGAGRHKTSTSTEQVTIYLTKQGKQKLSAIAQSKKVPKGQIVEDLLNQYELTQMSDIILTQEVNSSGFEECVNALRAIEKRLIEHYVCEEFPHSALYGVMSIRKLEGSLRGGTWLDVAKLYWQKESIIDYDVGNKHFWLVFPSGDNHCVREMALNIGENSLKAVHWCNNHENFLAINFVPVKQID